MNSLEIRMFAEAIKRFVNESTLPNEVKRLVLSEQIRKIEEQTNEELIHELNNSKGGTNIGKSDETVQ